MFEQKMIVNCENGDESLFLGLSSSMETLIEVSILKLRNRAWLDFGVVLIFKMEFWSMVGDALMCLLYE